MTMLGWGRVHQCLCRGTAHVQGMKETDARSAIERMQAFLEKGTIEGPHPDLSGEPFKRLRKLADTTDCGNLLVAYVATGVSQRVRRMLRNEAAFGEFLDLLETNLKDALRCSLKLADESILNLVRGTVSRMEENWRSAGRWGHSPRVDPPNG